MEDIANAQSYSKDEKLQLIEQIQNQIEIIKEKIDYDDDINNKQKLEEFIEILTNLEYKIRNNIKGIGRYKKSGSVDVKNIKNRAIKKDNYIKTLNNFNKKTLTNNLDYGCNTDRFDVNSDNITIRDGDNSYYNNLGITRKNNCEPYNSKEEDKVVEDIDINSNNLYKKNSFIKFFKEKIAQIETSYKTKINMLYKDNKLLKNAFYTQNKNFMKLEGAINNKQKEIESLNKIITNLKKDSKNKNLNSDTLTLKVEQFKSKINKLDEDNKDITAELSKKSEKYKELKYKYNKLEDKSSKKILELKESIKNLNNEISNISLLHKSQLNDNIEINKLHEELNNEVLLLRGKIDNNLKLENDYQNEINLLKENSSKYSLKIQLLEDKNNEINEKLNIANKEISKTNDKYTLKISNIKDKYSSKENEYQNKIAVLESKIEELNLELITKKEEIVNYSSNTNKEKTLLIKNEELNNKILLVTAQNEDLLLENKKIIEENNANNEKYLKVKEEYDHLKTELFNKEYLIKNNANYIDKLSQEKDNLYDLYVIEKNNNEKLNIKVTELQERIEALVDNEHSNNEIFNVKINNITANLQELENSNNCLTAQLLEQKELNNKLQTSNQKLKHKYKHLKATQVPTPDPSNFQAEEAPITEPIIAQNSSNVLLTKKNKLETISEIKTMIQNFKLNN